MLIIVSDSEYDLKDSCKFVLAEAKKKKFKEDAQWNTADLTLKQCTSGVTFQKNIMCNYIYVF